MWRNHLQSWSGDRNRLLSMDHAAEQWFLPTLEGKSLAFKLLDTDLYILLSSI